MLTLMLFLLLDFIVGACLGTYGWLADAQIFDFWQVCALLEYIAFSAGSILSISTCGAAAWKKLIYILLMAFFGWVIWNSGLTKFDARVVMVPITWIGYLINLLIGFYEGIKPPKN